ncbi:MAG: ATP-dependent helicase [Oscillospiraceae bacterium]
MSVRDEFINARKHALEMYFARLNDMQKKAVFTTEGPVLILAGAGSGKTSVLVNRIANMVNFGSAYNDMNVPASANEDDVAFLEAYNGEKDDITVQRLKEIAAVNPVDPWKIMAITFTNKAAGELKERLETMLGENANNITAATFHSVCVRILRREIEHLGYGSDFAIYDSDDSLRLLKSCYETLDMSDKIFNPKAVLAAISHAKDNLLTPELYAEQTNGDYYKLGISRLYTAYQKKLVAANAVDFDDIICLTVRLFTEFGDVLDHYSNRYRYIMVDEYQDTNYAQLRLVTLLSEKFGNLCVVGDDDQSIYKFRGATIENILKFEEQFGGAVVIRLEQNYRSTQNILNAANAVIANNSSRNDKKLWTDIGDGDKITLFKAMDEHSEAEFVADTVTEQNKNGREFRDFAVLYRTNAQSNALERVFTMKGIPYRVIGGLRFYDRKEIRDMIAYLSVINNNMDMLRFKRIINEPKRGIGDATVSMIEQISDDLAVSPISIMQNVDSYPMLGKKVAPLKKAAAMFEHLAEFAENEPLDRLVDEVLDVTGYGDYMRSLGEEGTGKLENIAELKSNIQNYIDSKGEDEEPTLSEFLEEISLFTDADRMDTTTDAVNLMTVHSAKGLEFETVFIVGAEEGIFPSKRSLDTLEDLEEERRLAYVAITRAKRKLYISHAVRRMMYGSTTMNTVSRFVKEIPSEYVERIDSTVHNRDNENEDDNFIVASPTYDLKSQIVNQQLKKAQKTEADFSVGERVSHNLFGEGTVISVKKISNDAMLEIAFDKVGTKKLMANFAKIKKI